MNYKIFKIKLIILMTDIQLTVIIPVFNEKNTIEILLQKFLTMKL